MSWVHGIDTGSYRIGVGIVDPATGAFTTVASQWRDPRRPTGALGRSLQKCRAQLVPFFAALAQHYPPREVVQELATGRPNPSLTMHGGVILEAATTGYRLAPHKIGTTEWKKIIHGKGTAAKGELRPWAASIGYAILDEDQIAGLAAAAARAHQLGLDLSLLHPTANPVREAA